jgi:hypothetical protein
VVDGNSTHPYGSVMPNFMTERLGRAKFADSVLEYLDPLMKASPVPIVSAYDYLWWMNFALKWQAVSLRLPVFSANDVRGLYEATRHFFRDDRFQVWCLAEPKSRSAESWPLYKNAAKAYIYQYTDDEQYFLMKQKEASLKNILLPHTTFHRVCAYMKEDFRPQFEHVAVLTVWSTAL